MTGLPRWVCVEASERAKERERKKKLPQEWEKKSGGKGKEMGDDERRALRMTRERGEDVCGEEEWREQKSRKGLGKLDVAGK